MPRIVLVNSLLLRKLSCIELYLGLHGEETSEQHHTGRPPLLIDFLRSPPLLLSFITS